MCVFVHMGGESVYDGERGYTKQQTYSCTLRVMSVLRYSLATTLSGEQKVYDIVPLKTSSAIDHELHVVMTGAHSSSDCSSTWIQNLGMHIIWTGTSAIPPVVPRENFRRHTHMSMYCTHVPTVLCTHNPLA